MLRLIIKDFYLSKKFLPFFGAWILFITLIRTMGSSSKPSPILALIPIFFAFVLVGNVIALDDKNKLDDIYCSLPLNRSKIVYAKYLSTLIIILIGIILSLLATLFFSEKIINLKSALYILFSLSIFFSVLFPISFRFGFQFEMEFGKIISVIFILIVTVVTIFLFVKIKINFIYLSFITSLFVFVSIKLSEYFYRRRDL